MKHRQRSAYTGGSDWIVTCECGSRVIRPTLIEADTAHAEHQRVELARAKASV